MKKLRPNIKFSDGHTMFDLFDNGIKQLYNITDEEYNYIIDNATDEEIQLFFDVDENKSFTDKRKSLEIRNKYLKR